LIRASREREQPSGIRGNLQSATLELFSPRGKDDFTMATANAMLCWVFGVLVY
jgi:hypothetical protein